MGQAKLRGMFEELQASAIRRDQELSIRKQELERKKELELTPEQRTPRIINRMAYV